MAEPTKPSIAILVDDLAAWIVTGHQPSGIQRVVSELLATAATRDDVRCWPAVTRMPVRGGTPDLIEVAPESLRWKAAEEATLSRRVLRRVRSAIRELPLPAGIRRAARVAYRWLAMNIGGVERSQPTSEAPDMVLVPGGFWAGDGQRRLEAMSEGGLTLRLVVYDLLAVLHPEWFEREVSNQFRQVFDAVVPLADRVVTMSEEVKEQVEVRYPTLRGRVRVGTPTLRAHVTSTGSQPVPVDALPAQLAGPFMFALSTVEPRKNYRVILDAWRVVRQDPRSTSWTLAVVGRRGWMADDIEREIERDAEALGIVRLASADDGLVERLYDGCHGTVHASWSEGFGLPVRESIVRGIPTLVSTGIPRDGLVEGTYDAFDPNDAAHLARLMKDVLAANRVRHRVEIGGGTGWEPMLSALIDG